MCDLLTTLVRAAVAGLLLVASGIALAARPADDASRTRWLCERTAVAAATDPRMGKLVAIAQDQHRLFGGQVIDPAGGIVSVGFHEAEFDHAANDTTPTWSRVAAFWAALDKDLPETFTAPGPRRVDRARLFEQLKATSFALGAGQAETLDAQQLDAIHSSLLRSALIDHPWSAVFLSYLMQAAGFSGDEFAFSDSHITYVKKAFTVSEVEAAGMPDVYAYRACDVRTTKPRPGDLLCHTRGTARMLDSFAGLRAELRRRDASGMSAGLPMHCDIVVNADENGNAKLATIGGNVFQSVTLRHMSLNARKHLGASYFGQPESRGCSEKGGSCRKGVSRQPWVVLLQSREQSR